MPEHQQIQQSKKPNTIFQKQSTPTNQTPISNPYSIIQRAKINPKSLTHADIMQLQRTIGNRAVGRLLTGIGNTSTVQQATIQRQEIPEEEEPLQGKIIETVQRQEIPEEEEPLQGKMAETIQRQEIPEEEEPLQGKMIGTIQRQEIPEEEEPLQGKFENEPEIACPSCFAAPIVQRQKIPEEEEPLQGKIIDTVQRQEIPEEEEPLQTKRENNTGMPDNLKASVESLSGIDMSDVRVQYNSSKPAEVGASAYTQGTNIHVAPGQDRHLPHEAWHVVQQAQGRVKPTMQMKGVAVNDDIGLELEADNMGEISETVIKDQNTSEVSFTDSIAKENEMKVEYHKIDANSQNIHQRKVNLSSAPVIQRWIKMARLPTGDVSENFWDREKLLADRKEKELARLEEIEQREGKELGDQIVRARTDASLAKIATPSPFQKGLAEKEKELAEKEKELARLEEIEQREGKELGDQIVRARTDASLAKIATLPFFEKGKPIDSQFTLLTNFEEASKEVDKALKFLFGETIKIEQVEVLLKTWMGVATNGDRKGDVVITGDQDYESRRINGIQAEMRYYHTYYELAWALVRTLGLDQKEKLKGDTKKDEELIAYKILINESVKTNLRSVCKKVLEAYKSRLKVIDAGKLKTLKTQKLDYGELHGDKSFEEIFHRFEKPDQLGQLDVEGMISRLHDVSAKFFLVKELTWAKPEKIENPLIKFGEIETSKDKMRYNVSTVDEADDLILFLRGLGHNNLWAGPSYTAYQMINMADSLGCGTPEKEAIAYAIFAYWCVKYPHTATPIHTFHEVMITAQMLGVRYNPKESAKQNYEHIFGMI